MPGGGVNARRSIASASPMCNSVFENGASDVAQAGLEALVDLDHVHERGPRGEPLRKHAEAAADLEHDVVGGQRRQPLDHVEDVAIDQEVLAQLTLARRASAHHPNTAAALSSIDRSSSA